MNLVKKSNEFFANFDAKFAYHKDDLGAIILGNKISIKLWQPLAKEVNLLLYKKTDLINPWFKFPMQKLFEGSNSNVFAWHVEINKNKYQSMYYNFEIVQANNDITRALDPYAKSMAPFNWEGLEHKVGLGAFIDFNSHRVGTKPRDLNTNLNNSVDPNIYEMHVRDFTSLLINKPKYQKVGKFNNLLKQDLFGYLNKLHFTHLQLLPLQASYTVNDLDKTIYQKATGKGWTTNYNWGYDPHNYFTLNGLYSSNPKDPYKRIKEFRALVDKAHEQNIGVIVDVVYNHMMTNSIFDNILPGYYYRDKARKMPVNYPPLADERFMVKKLMLESLKYYVETFNVDGFRFDLSCFHHKETLDEIAFELRKLNPKLILHGEAWPFSDLEFEESYIKGFTNNKIKFGYFNDTLRDAIKGTEHESYNTGLIHKYSKTQFKQYVTSVVAGLKEYDFKDTPHSKTKYDLYNDDVGINLSYSACHDGMTLWDKLNILNPNKSFKQRVEAYRQGLMMSLLTQGRHLTLAGTELLQSKPCDLSGEEGFKCQVSEYDDFNEKPDNQAFMPNSYKTTDYTNGLKWNHLKNPEVKTYVFDFLASLNKFRLETSYLRLDTNTKVFERLKFIYSDIEKGILIYSIANNDNTKELLALHNFADYDFNITKYQGKTLFNSKLEHTPNILNAHSTQIIERNK